MDGELDVTVWVVADPEACGVEVEISEFAAMLYPGMNAVPFCISACAEMVKVETPGSLQQLVVLPPLEQHQLLSLQR